MPDCGIRGLLIIGNPDAFFGSDKAGNVAVPGVNPVAVPLEQGDMD